jgi:hypothetical protein
MPEKELLQVVQLPQIQNEKLLPLCSAVHAATGTKPHLSTVLRWSTRGTADGIRLETQILGGRRLTSVEAVLRYMAATTEARDGAAPSMAPPAQNERAAERSAKKLAQRLGR